MKKLSLRIVKEIDAEIITTEMMIEIEKERVKEKLKEIETEIMEIEEIE